MGRSAPGTGGGGTVWTLIVLGVVGAVVSSWMQFDVVGPSGDAPDRWRIFVVSVVSALSGPLLIGGLVGLVLLRLRR